MIGFRKAVEGICKLTNGNIHVFSDFFPFTETSENVDSNKIQEIKDFFFIFFKSKLFKTNVKSKIDKLHDYCFTLVKNIYFSIVGC